MTTIAYFIPTYPMPSQTFIRREIVALETQGFTIHRFSLRRFDGTLADEADRSEEKKTCSLLELGAFPIAVALLREFVTRPRRWKDALSMAVKLGRRSDRGLGRHLVYFAEACLLRQLLANCGARHLHVHFGTNAAETALLCRLLGGPGFSITIHGPEEFDSPQALGLREKVRHAAFVVAISQFTRSQLYRWCDHADWGKIRVIRCGLDEVFLNATTAPVPLRPKLVNVGRLSEQKGQLLLVRAAAILRDRGYDFELVIVGDGQMRAAIEEQINKRGLSEYVRITGYLSNQDVRRELESARALVLPSFAEGLPVVIMETLALGRPVISTYIAGIPELVEPGVNGWLVPAGAAEPLVDAMTDLLSLGAAELDRMGRSGKARVAELHDAKTEAAKLAELFSNPVTPAVRLSPTRIASNSRVAQ
jgi:colanic acid/amylovoran biosynthesis glycosyltransferase